MHGFERPLICMLVLAAAYCIPALCGSSRAADYIAPKMGKASPIMANTYGYVPDQAKRFLFRGPEGSYDLVDTASGRIVHSGILTPAEGGDLTLAELKSGDFTGFKAPGRYVLRVGQYESWPFDITPDALNGLVWNGANYLQEVRAGDSVTGFRAWTNNVSHLDDGLLGEDLATRLGMEDQWFDMVGGWYDATDVRYWTSSWLALEFVQQVAERVKPPWTGTLLLDELKYGNQLFLKTILPSGEVLNPQKSENYWTDNVIGSGDERIVAESINNWDHAYQLAYYELSLSRVFKDSDPGYAKVMEGAGRRIVRNLSQSYTGTGAVDRGLKVLAFIEMYRSTGEKTWFDMARQEGQGILDLQEKDYVEGQSEVKGFIYSDDQRDGTPDIRAHESVHLFALMGLARVDSKNPAWLGALKSYCRDFLLPISKRNPYHLVPARILISDTDKAGRRLGDSRVYYRYFRPEGDSGNATGINPSLLSNAAILMEVGRLTTDSELVGLAWEQFNYILGMNRYNASTVEGAGNVPVKFNGGQGVTNSFPRVSGAVLNGMATRAKDEPFLDNGWEAGEYWLPQFGWFGRFLAAAGAGQSGTNFGVLPKTAVLKTGRKQRFYLDTGTQQRVSWTIDGIPGGSAEMGTIDADGTYTAPTKVPMDGQVPKKAFIINAIDPAGSILGSSQVRIIQAPAGPMIKATQDKTTVMVEWKAVPDADTYNIEVKDPVDRFFRILRNISKTSIKLPIQTMKGKTIRVVPVNHKLGYGLPSTEYLVK